MFLRLLHKTFTRSFKDKLLLMITVAFGASLASFMLNFSLDIGDKMNQELKSYGANIQVEPKMDTIPVEMDGMNINPLGKQAFLQEEGLNKLNKIFWANNILNYVPYLETTGKLEGKHNTVRVIGTWFNEPIQQNSDNESIMGLSTMKSWWKIDGVWPSKKQGISEIVIGKQLAKELNIEKNSDIKLKINSLDGSKNASFHVVGIVDADGIDDKTIFISLKTMQNLLNLKEKISSLEVSALTVPENELAKRAGNNPSYLNEKEYETWYCTAYASTIAYQIEEVMKGSAKPIRQIAQSEGVILNKIKFMMIIISAAAIICSALGITSLMNSKISERRMEIALMKAIGATEFSVVSLFICEAIISGIIGGLAGYGIGILITQFIGQAIFGTVIKIKLIGLPIILLLSILITALGSYPTVRKIIGLDPVSVLKGR
jgi:putative ABC transport system permease protein